jgi:hypothetical protein
MKTILPIFVLLYSQQLFAIENLSQSDFIGTWASQWTVIEGENQLLTILEDKSSVFERNYEDGSKQVVKSKNIEYLDDLLIIKYTNKNGQLIVKLVMSGWHSYGRYQLYGTMYMYNEGKLYNGLTVSFARDK